MNGLSRGFAAAGRRALLRGGIAAMAAAKGAVSAAAREGAVAVDVSDGRCVVPMRLDGRMARMVVDTGAERSVLTRAAALRLGLRRDPWVDTPMAGAGGLVERRPNVDAGSASLGGVALFQGPGRGLSLAVTDLSLGDADGLLGADMLRHFTLDLDMPKARLALRQGAMLPANALPLHPWAGGLLLGPLRLDGQALTALVDTGASGTLINARGLIKLGITPARAAQDPTIRTESLGGRFQAHLHRFATLQFGPLTLRDPALLAAFVPEAAFDVILGLDILGRQRLLLSYASLRLGFEPG